MDIHLKISYTPEDLQQAYTLHYRAFHPIRSRTLLILGILLILIGIIPSVFLNGSRDFRYLFTKDFTSLIFLFYGVLVIFFYFWSRRKIGKRVFKRLPTFQDPITFSITNDKVTIETKDSHNESKWSYYKKAIISDSMILTYPNDFNFNLFPKKYFKDEQWEHFSELVKENIKDHKIVK